MDRHTHFLPLPGDTSKGTQKCTHTHHTVLSNLLNKYNQRFRRDRWRDGGLDFDKDKSFDIVKLFIPVNSIYFLVSPQFNIN